MGEIYVGADAHGLFKIVTGVMESMVKLSANPKHLAFAVEAQSRRNDMVTCHSAASFWPSTSAGNRHARSALTAASSMRFAPLEVTTRASVITPCASKRKRVLTTPCSPSSRASQG